MNKKNYDNFTRLADWLDELQREVQMSEKSGKRNIHALARLDGAIQTLGFLGYGIESTGTKSKPIIVKL